MPTKIITCNCNTGSGCEYQDEVYGKGRRVANQNSNKLKPEFKCTCCGKVQ